MTRVVADRFSESEVESALLEIVREAAGFSEATLSLDETIDLCFKRCDGPNSIWAKLGLGIWDELDFADILFLINEHFGLTISIAEWKAELWMPERYSWSERRIPTWREIAAVVLAKAERVVIKPRAVLGRSCVAAGVFDALSELVARVSGDRSMRIAPSDSLRERLGSRMDDFRRHTEMNFGLPLPNEPAARTWLRSIATIVALGSGFLGFVLICGAKFGAAGCCALLLALAWSAGAIIDRYWTPLPAELRTFKGLSRWVAARLGE